MAKKKAAKKKAAKKPAAKKAPPVVKKGPRQTALPGMEDRAIAALQDAAMSYAEIRDQRVALSAQEVELKNQLLDLMHGYKKTHYSHGNVVIDIVPEKETIKVKIKKADDMSEEELQAGQDEPSDNPPDDEPEPPEQAEEDEEPEPDFDEEPEPAFDEEEELG